MIGIAIASSPVRRRLRYLGVGVELAAPEYRQDGDRIIVVRRDGAQDSINQVGKQWPGATSTSSPV